MSKTNRKRSYASTNPADTPEVEHMRTCCNCDQPAQSAIALGTAGDGRFSRPLPLCMACATKVQSLFDSPAGYGAIMSLCVEMSERTGQEWVFDDDDTTSDR